MDATQEKDEAEIGRFRIPKYEPSGRINESHMGFQFIAFATF